MIKYFIRIGLSIAMTSGLAVCVWAQDPAPKPADYRMFSVDSIDSEQKAAVHDDGMEVFKINRRTFDEQFAPYYAQLSEEEKKIYRQVVTAIINHEGSIKIENTAVGNRSSYRIDLAISIDQPELFWFDSLTRVRYYAKDDEDEDEDDYEDDEDDEDEDDDEVDDDDEEDEDDNDDRDDTDDGRYIRSLTYEINYNDLALDLAKHQKEMVDELNKMLEVASKYPKIYQKELAIHDYLVDHVSYVTDSDYDQTSYSALVNHETVCSGFARGFQMAMRKLGVPTYYASGHKIKGKKKHAPTDDDRHAWNVVILDGNAYNVDVTNDASTIKGRDGEMHPFSIYKYFNRTDEFFSSQGYTTQYKTFDETEGLKLSTQANSLEFVANKVVDTKYLVQRISSIFPVTEDDFVSTSREFARRSREQLWGLKGEKGLVCTILMNNHVYHEVHDYSWPKMEKEFLNEIYKTYHVDGKSINRMDKVIMDGVRIFVSRYTFKRTK